MTYASKFTLASFFLIFLFSSNLQAQCPSGSVFIFSQADLENFVNTYPNCTKIDGGLYLGSYFAAPSDLSDLSKLNNIVDISDGLVITNTNALTNLDNFSSLSKISGAIQISFNTGLLNMNGLTGAIGTIDQLDIVQNPLLVNLFGLDNFQIKNVNLVGNTNLTTLEGLGYASYLEYLTIQNNQNLTDLSDLTDLEIVKNLKIVGNDKLANLDGFDNMKLVESSFSLINNPLLIDISGLSKLEEVHGGLTLVNLPGLAKLNGLTNLYRIGQLIIENNSNLISISALGLLNNVSSISILNNPSLVSLEGLSEVKQLNHFVVNENNALTNLNGISQLTSVKLQFTISNNDNLKSLETLVNLSEISGIVEIKQNLKLNDLSAIDQVLLNGTKVEISNNPDLKVCDVTSVCNYVNASFGIAVINDNDLGCKNVGEIKSACSGLALAVELLDFTVVQKAKKAALNWRTSNENNNLGFEVERSTDGIGWEKIGWVDGIGNNTIYSFMDEYPNKGTNYYRLQQVDFNGGKNGSEVKQIYFKFASITGLSVYPNPASNKINIEVPTSLNQNEGIIYLYDLNGQIQKEWPLVTNQKIHGLNLQGLPSGLYIIQIADLQEKLYIDDQY